MSELSFVPIEIVTYYSLTGQFSFFVTLGNGASEAREFRENIESMGFRRLLPKIGKGFSWQTPTAPPESVATFWGARPSR